MTTAMLLNNPNVTAWAEKFGSSEEISKPKNDSREAIKLRTEILLATAPDDRLALMESPEWAFKEEHLRQVNHVVKKFINEPARRQLRELAIQCLDSGDSPFAMVHRWLTKERYETLGQLVSQTTVPDHLMIFCYTWLEIYETAIAIYILEGHRRKPKPDFGNLEQTAEEHEGDRRFANLA